MDKLKQILEAMGSDLLNEDTRKEIETLFEGVIKEKTDEIKSQLTSKNVDIIKQLKEEFESQKADELAELKRKSNILAEEYEDSTVDWVERELLPEFNQYVTHCAEEYIKENKAEVQNTIKANLYEKLANGIRNVLSENMIPEKEVEGLENVIEINATLKESLDKKEIEIMTLKDEIKSSEVVSVFNECTKDLSVSQKSRLKLIAEDYSVRDLGKFKEKIEAAKKLVTETKTFTPPKKSGIDHGGNKTLNEDNDTADINYLTTEDETITSDKIDSFLSSDMMNETNRHM